MHKSGRVYLRGALTHVSAYAFATASTQISSQTWAREVLETLQPHVAAVAMAVAKASACTIHRDVSPYCQTSLSPYCQTSLQDEAGLPCYDVAALAGLQWTRFAV